MMENELDLGIVKGEMVENLPLSDGRPWKEILAADDHKHHLQLKCPECGNIYTCRCSAEKITVFAWCDACHPKMAKGGPGSGSWEGPGDPRFVHEGAGAASDSSREGSVIPNWNNLMERSSSVLDKVTSKYNTDSSELFETVNAALYPAEGKLGIIGDKNTRQMIRDLDEAFSAAPLIGENVILYRGITNSIPDKNIYIDRGFAMMTTDRKEAMDYAVLGDTHHTLFEVSVPKNAKLIVNSPNEIVFPRDSKYSVKGIENKNGVTVIKLEWQRIAELSLYDYAFKDLPKARRRKK